MTKRIQTIDNLRGLAIILMLLQHIPLFLVENVNTPIYSLTIILSRFSAPLFFILAGYCTCLSFRKTGPTHIIKRSAEVFLYGILTNIFRQQSLLSINVLTSISVFMIVCTIILYIKSKYAYAILFIGLLSYSFMGPEIVSSIHHPTDILNMGEYPIAPWLIYAIIGLGIAWIDKMKNKKLLVPFSIVSIIYGLTVLIFGYYKLSFISNTPPFMFMVLGFIGIIYMLISMVKSNVLGTFGKNSLFVYVSHMFLFSFIPVIIGIGKPFSINAAIVIYIATLTATYYLLKE